MMHVAWLTLIVLKSAFFGGRPGNGTELNGVESPEEESDLRDSRRRTLAFRSHLRACAETGQALAEEALILALIGVLAVSALTALQGSVSDTFGHVVAGFGLLEPVR